MPFDRGINGDGNAYMSLSGIGLSSDLMQIMEQEAFDPGATLGYQAAKTIYAHHPLGAAMVDKPLQMAMSQERVIEIPGAPEEMLIKQYRKTWKRIGGIGANNIIYRVAQLSFIYGISTLCCNYTLSDGTGAPTNETLPFDELHRLNLYFNIYDPLNTAGSLVLNQDPAAVDFLHPKQVVVGKDSWSNTKAIVIMHEQPIWIEWTDSAFGFVGRSVYQRSFYPLKSFLNSMIADNMVQDKLGLIVYRSASPGSVLDQASRAFKSMFRSSIKGARTNNVVSIGESESLESLDLTHVHEAGEYSRNNIIKNIATGAGQPAILLNQETLAEGFGEGTEDAKQLARYIDRVRIEINPLFEFMDNIVARIAWSPDFYKSVQKAYPEQYGGLSYKAALHEWLDAFTPTWPNLLSEPDSEKAKASQLKIETAQKVADSLFAVADPENKAVIAQWLADNVSDEKEFYSTPLVIDADAMAQYVPPVIGESGDEDE